MPNRPRWPHRKWAWGIGAGLAASLVLTAAWLLWPQASGYRTPVGGLESVPMADGSTVTLNTDTALTLAVTQRERRVTLEHGEAFFEVAKDPTRPFVVQAGRHSVIAVGTQFAVRRDGADTQVVVTEGTVRLEGADAQQSAGSASVRMSRSGTELLPAGTVAHAGDAGVLVQKETPSEAEEHLSWRQGVLVFHDATLADAVAEFNRYNVRQVVIDDPSVAAFKVAGDFRATNVDAFVRLLERGYPLKVEQRDDQVVLKAR